MMDSFRVGEWRVEPDRARLRNDRGDIRVEPKAMRVLVRLARNASEVVTREELISDVWDGAFVTDEVLSSAIRKLRRALDDDAKSPRYIQTVAGVGYRLIADVGSLDVHDSPSPWWQRRAGAALFVFALTGLAISMRAPVELGSSWVHTPATSLPGLERGPALSPDGALLAFAWNRAEEASLPQLYVSVVGQQREPTQLTNVPGDVERVTWSRDGTQLAYLSHIDAVTGEPITSVRGIPPAAHAIYVVPVIGGTPRLVGKTNHTGAHALDWSPDGTQIVIVDRSQPSEPDSLFLLDIDSGARTRISFPPTASDEDGGGVFSPDGRSLAFIRAKAPYGQQGEVHLLALDSKTLTPLSRGLDVNDVEWNADGRSLLAVSRRKGGSVWQLDSETLEQRKLQLLISPNDISLSISGERLAYAVQTSSFGVWRVRGPRAAERAEPALLIQSTRVDSEASYSPDGRQIAFQSSRSGESRLYVVDADGSHAIQLAPFRTDGIPRWSPDGNHIIVEGYRDGPNADLFIVPVAGGAPRKVAAFDGNELDPAFSPDGSRIFFASDRAGALDVWSIETEGSDAERLTFDGGRAPQPSDDGFVYFSKSSSAQRSAIWSVPASGGEPREVLTRQPHFKEWQLWQNTIVFVDQAREDGPAIMVKDLDTGEMRVVEALGAGVRTSVGLSVSPDGAWVLYTRLQTSGDIALLERRHGRRVF